jgi:hypothetical protein
MYVRCIRAVPTMNIAFFTLVVGLIKTVWVRLENCEYLEAQN